MHSFQDLNYTFSMRREYWIKADIEELKEKKERLAREKAKHAEWVTKEETEIAWLENFIAQQQNEQEILNHNTK